MQLLVNVLDNANSTLKTFAREVVRIFRSKEKRRELTEMIQNEARVIRKFASLGEQDNIVVVLRQRKIRNCGMYYIDMELCDGNKLEQFIEENYLNEGSIPMPSVWSIMMQINSAVVFFKHEEVHRDLKPRNGNTLQLN
jgi:serine/threonine protein kinase